MNQVSRRSIVRGITGAAALGALSVAGAATATAAPSKTTLKVLVLNAWHGGKQIAGGVGMIADIIQESGATLVFIPEANETTPDIVAKLNAQGLSFQYRITGDNAIVSAYPVGEATSLPYMTKAVVTVGSVEIAAYAAHLQYQWYATYLPRAYGPGSPSGEFSEFGWNKIPSGPVTDAAAVDRVNEASGRPQVIAQFIADSKRNGSLDAQSSWAEISMNRLPWTGHTAPHSCSTTTAWSCAGVRRRRWRMPDSWMPTAASTPTPSHTLVSPGPQATPTPQSAC